MLVSSSVQNLRAQSLALILTIVASVQLLAQTPVPQREYIRLGSRVIAIEIPVPLTISAATTTALAGQSITLTSNLLNTQWRVSSGPGSVAPASGGATVYTAPNALAGNGQAVVQATGPEGQTAEITITLLPMTVVVVPQTLTLPAGQVHTFTASVSNAPETAVSWSVVQGTGTIDPSTGRYTAPSVVPVAVVEKVRATSVINASSMGDALVTVTPIATNLNPAAATFTSAGGTGTVKVSSSTSWTAKSDVPWIQVTTGSNGNGPGDVGYSVSPLPAGEAARSGTITIAGIPFRVDQSAALVALSLDANRLVYNQNASDHQATLVRCTAGKTYVATSSDPWVVVPNTPQQCNSQLRPVVAMNSGGGRTALITVTHESQSVILTIEQLVALLELFPNPITVSGSSRKKLDITVNSAPAAVDAVDVTATIGTTTRANGFWEFLAPAMAGEGYIDARIKNTNVTVRVRVTVTPEGPRPVTISLSSPTVNGGADMTVTVATDAATILQAMSVTIEPVSGTPGSSGCYVAVNTVPIPGPPYGVTISEGGSNPIVRSGNLGQANPLPSSPLGGNYSRCTIKMVQSSYFPNTLTLVISFAGGLIGPMNVNAYTQSTAGVMSHANTAQFQVINPANVVPALVSVTPSANSTAHGSLQTFEFAYKDVNGFNQIQRVEGLFGTTGGPHCWFYFYPSSRQLDLVSASSSLSLGISVHSVENSSCRIYGSRSSFRTEGEHTVIVRLSIFFKPALQGSTAIQGSITDTQNAHVSLRPFSAGAMWTVPSGLPYANAEFFGRHNYIDFLVRDASRPEIDWTLTTPRPTIVGLLYDSAEYKLKGRLIAGLYRMLLNREVNFDEWEWRSTLIMLSTPPIDQANGIVYSSEFITNNGGPLDDNRFITLLYQNGLKRQPSAYELQVHAAHLAGGYSRGQKAIDFVLAQEFELVHRNSLLARLLYMTCLRRPPEPGAMEYWIWELDSGNKTREVVMNDFITSPEYQVRFQ